MEIGKTSEERTKEFHKFLPEFLNNPEKYPCKKSIVERKETPLLHYPTPSNDNIRNEKIINIIENNISVGNPFEKEIVKLNAKQIEIIKSALKNNSFVNLLDWTFEGIKRKNEFEITKYIDELILSKRKLYKANNRILKLSKDLSEKKEIKKENVELKNGILILENILEEKRKQMGTYNQYFPNWESLSMNIPKGQKQKFYENEFISDNPELKNYPYAKFISNLKSSISQRKKALLQHSKG